MANPPATSDAERFAELYRRDHSDVLRFVARRLDPPDLARAEDITHEAFLVAWRRLRDVPTSPNDARAWLFTTARNCLLNAQRAEARGQQLPVRIAADAAGFVPPPSDGVNHRVDLATAWAVLSPGEQEVIALTVWDGLTSTEAGRVLGISGPTYRLRLHRARLALRRAYEAPGPQAALPHPPENQAILRSPEPLLREGAVGPQDYG